MPEYDTVLMHGSAVAVDGEAYLFIAPSGTGKSTHSFRHTFASRLVNGVKQPDGSLLCLSPKQVADLLGHSTSEITEMYGVRS